MPRFALVVALLAACAVEDPPPPAPPTGPVGDPRSLPSPVDAGGDTDDPFPDAGGPSVDAADLSCGGFGDTCCPDAPFCAAEFTHCDEGLCAGCGDIAQSCCNQGTPCQGGLSCSSGVCGP
jgi:hypothetical protein